jgi:hypothetical protein
MIISVTVSLAIRCALTESMLIHQLYLPRTYSSGVADGRVMVGNQVARGGDDAASNALMSLLREGGQWDDADDKRIKGSQVDDLKGEDEDEWAKRPERNSVVSLIIHHEFKYADQD